MGSLMKASEIAAMLDLKPHQEGGYYAETFRDHSITLSKSQLPDQYKVDRPVSTSIYFLLPSGSASHLHRIPCAETWHFYMGEPLTGQWNMSNIKFVTPSSIAPSSSTLMKGLDYTMILRGKAR